MKFERLHLNDGNGFKKSSPVSYNYFSLFRCPSSGIYWFICSAFLNGTGYAHLIMTGTQRYPSFQIWRKLTMFETADTISMSSMQNLTTDQELRIFTISNINANKYYDLSWGTFRLDSLMPNLVAFDVTLWKSSRTNEFLYQENINIGGGWFREQNCFIASKAGIYYFSASVGIKNIAKIFFSVNQSLPHCAFEVTNANDREITSRGCLLKLEDGNRISLTIYSFENVVNNLGVTSFRGFFYTPPKKDLIAWSLHINKDIQTTQNFTLKFDVTLVDTLNVWNKSSNELCIPVSGRYLLEIAGNAYSQAGLIDMLLVDGHNMVIRLLFPSKVGSVSRSRTTIAALKQGSTLRVVTSTYSDLYGRMSGLTYHGISFQGLLLYPD